MVGKYIVYTFFWLNLDHVIKVSAQTFLIVKLNFQLKVF